MKIFDTPNSSFTPRADMFLPNFMIVLSIFLEVAAVACVIVALVMKIWALIIGFVILCPIGIAAYLCWKNQSVKIIDEYKFEYTTFLGKKTIYSFSEIKELRVNQDSLTLFVGDGKVHIESIAIISQNFIDKINEALKKNGQDLLI